MRARFLSAPSLDLPSSRPAGAAGAAVMHAVAIAVLVLAATRPPLLPPAGNGPPSPAVVAAPPPELLPAPVLTVSSLRLEAIAAMPPAAEFTTAEGFTYDTSKIRQRREVLFPFLTGELPFLRDLREASALDRQRLRTPLRGGERQRRPGQPPLEITAAAREALVDRAWSRRDRWHSLASIAELTARHDPDAGALPLVVRGHVERNLLQPYVDGTAPDPRFWVMLGLASDHMDVIEFVGRYAQRHASSRTTTELLFLLDELAEANRNAFELLMNTNVETLTSTASASPLDLQLANQLQRGYRTWTRDHGLADPKSQDERYDAMRLSILTTIIETSPGGYGAADARFLAGRLLWDRSDIDGAVRMWRGMEHDDRTTYAGVRAEIGQALHPDGSVDVIRIVRALGAERSRWLRESADRLTRFGYTPQKF